MKTFKSKYLGQSHQELNIVRLNDGVRVSVDHGSHGAMGIVITQSDAPALALAILEAAGHGKASDSSRLMQAFDLIELHVNEQERATAEAKEQAELEAEALDFFNAGREEMGLTPYVTYERLDEYSRRKWLAVARKAREMRTEK